MPPFCVHEKLDAGIDKFPQISSETDPANVITPSSPDAVKFWQLLVVVLTVTVNAPVPVLELAVK